MFARDWYALGLARVAAGAVLAAFVLTHRPPDGAPQPAYVRPSVFFFVGLLALAGGIQLARRFRSSRRWALAGLAVDVAAAVALPMLYAFDPGANLFTPTLLVMVEGAVLLGRRGALEVWAVTATGYVLAEAWVARQYGSQDAAAAVGLRALIGLVLALLIGMLVHEVAKERVKYRALVEQVPAVIYAESTRGISDMRYISPQVERVLGYSPRDWDRDPELWTKLIHPDDRNRILEQNQVCIDKGVPFSEEYRLIARDGRDVWVRDSASLVLDETGAPAFWQGVMTDITELKKAQLARSELSEIVRSSGDAIISKTLDGVIVSWNAGAERIYGYTADEVEGRSISILVPPERPDEVPQILERIKRGERVDHYETTRIRKDGRRIDVSLTVSPIEHAEGRITGASVVARDVTERKRQQEELERALLREREATERLIAVDGMRKTLLHAVAHDLRTPLSAILAVAMLVNREGGVASGKREQLLQRLIPEARKMDRLLSDLLDLDRLEHGVLQPNRSPTDMRKLVGRVVEDVRTLDARQVVVEAEPCVALVDEAKVERIVENLLTNAVKHTPDGTPVWVRVWRKNDGVAIAVEDAGQGVPQETRETIFEPFKRGDGGPSRTPGMGIGLSIVARFAELHGGRAWVEERAGGGASFRVYLPESNQTLVADDRPTSFSPTNERPLTVA